jgi:hypothetical protein
MEVMSSRRAFLGTLGKALGAGGVLLPLAGKGALALPAELGKAAALPVMPTPLPVSAEMLRLREIRRELHNIYLAEYHSYNDRCAAWRDVMRKRHEPTAQQIIGRKKPNWSDCVEIAEVALHRMHRLGPREENDVLHKLVFAVLSAGGINEVFVPEIGDFSLEEAPKQLW